MRNIVIAVIALVLILAGGWWYFAHESDVVVETIQNTETTQETTESTPSQENQGAAIGDENLVTFQCAGGKSITAVFERDIVGLTLSDGRQIVLRQAVSGSGIRYLSNDTKIEFRGKGMDGYLVENGATTYADCKASN